MYSSPLMMRVKVKDEEKTGESHVTLVPNKQPSLRGKVTLFSRKKDSQEEGMNDDRKISADGRETVIYA